MAMMVSRITVVCFYIPESGGRSNFSLKSPSNKRYSSWVMDIECEEMRQSRPLYVVSTISHQ